MVFKKNARVFKLQDKDKNLKTGHKMHKINLLFKSTHCLDAEKEALDHLQTVPIF